MEGSQTKQFHGYPFQQVIWSNHVQAYNKYFKGNCYKSNRRNVLVRNPIRYHVGRATTSDPYTECNEKCKAKNYSYFGLRNAKACWCGKWAPIPTSKLVMKKCNRMCTGNSSLRCGGRRALNVWKVCTEANCSFSYE